MTVTDMQREAEYRLTRWDLSELLPEPSQEVIAERLTELEDDVTAFEGWRDRLDPAMDPDEFLAALQHFERIDERQAVLESYGSLWFAEDTQSRTAHSYRNRLQQILTTLENRTLFFELWWKGLDDEEARRLLPTAPEHADYRHYLETLRRLRPFILDESSEQIIRLKDSNGITGLLTLYSMLTNRLEFHLEVDGETRTFSRDALTSFIYSPSPELRAATYHELYRVYEREATIVGQIYVNRVRDWYSENVELRGFASPLSVRNVHNDVPDAAVEALLESVRDNADLFRRYFQLKASWLGMERLRRYDIYAPLATSDRTISYPEAVEKVLSTLESFHPTFARHAERVFALQHIDSELRRGKRSGAFCATVSPGFTPWVLLNYTGRVRDVATLAHELGHAIHSMVADHHSILTQHPSLPLAETASVFSEMLLTDRLLQEEPDPLIRREILASFVDDIYATVLRQAYFVLFERAAHDAIRGGASLDELNALYMANLQEQFADSVEVAPEFQYEWLCVPHFFSTPFYCYAYSFGQLLVLALYRRYEEEGESFKPGYLKMLSYGGAARPETILQEAGIDISDPGFWKGGFEVVAERIRELEEIPV